MRTYANPALCPGCDAPATGAPRCARCGIELRGLRPDHVLELFREVDGILTELRAEARRWSPETPTAARTYWEGPSADGGVPPMPMSPTRPAEPTRRWSVGSWLLALGALCLVVAALVFVSVSWGSLGIGGRTAILGAVTLGFGGGATWATAARLRGATESLWVVTGVMSAIDAGGARAYGLLGTDRLSASAFTLGYSCLLLIACVAVVVLARRRLDGTLVAGQVGAVLASWAAVAAIGGLVDLPEFWALSVCVVAASALAVAFTRLGLVWVAVLVGTQAVLAYVGAAGLAAYQLLADVSIGAWIGDLTVVPVPLCAVAAAGAAALLRRPATRSGRRGTADTLATTGALVASAHLLLVAYAPVLVLPPDAAVILTVAIALAVFALSTVGVGPWGAGVRIATAGTSIPLIALLAAWVAAAASSILHSLSPVWGSDALAAVTPKGLPLEQTWTASTVALGLAGCSLLLLVWRGIPRSRLMAVAAVSFAALGVVVQLGLHPVPLLTLAGLAASSGLAAVVAGRLRGVAAAEVIGVALLVVAGILPIASQVDSAITWASLAGLSVLGALVARNVIAQAAYGAQAVVWSLAATVTILDLAGVPPDLQQLTSAVVAAVVLLGAQALVYRPVTRVAVEVTATAVGTAALAWGVVFGPAWEAMSATALGVALVIVSLVRRDRRPLAVAGGIVLAAAYVLRLLGWEVDVVEAYTLPLGVVLVAVGVLAMRRDPRLRTRVALLPGVCLVLLPSLPQFLADPVSLRGLLLGLGAVGVLGWAVGRRLQSPFLVSAGVLAVVVLRNLGPYADAVPRWSLIAVVGAGLLGIGITWEARVRDARAATEYVGNLR